MVLACILVGAAAARRTPQFRLFRRPECSAPTTTVAPASPRSGCHRLAVGDELAAAVLRIFAVDGERAPVAPLLEGEGPNTPQARPESPAPGGIRDCGLALVCPVGCQIVLMRGPELPGMSGSETGLFLTLSSRLSDRPRVSADFKPWEGWGHVREHVEAASGIAPGSWIQGV